MLTSPVKNCAGLQPWLLRAIGSAVVLSALLYLFPFQDVWNAARKVPYSVWLTVFAIFVLGHLVAAWKWWFLINEAGEIPFRMAVRAHFAGLAANLCLPGVSGGELVRAAIVCVDAPSKTRIAIRSLADRLLDCLALFAISMGAALIMHDSADKGLRLMGLIGAALAGVCVALPLMLRLVKTIRAPITGKLVKSVEELKNRPFRVLICFSISTTVQCVFTMLSYSLGSSVGVNVAATAWFFAWPLAKLISVLPISLAGLGVREASLATILAGFGAPVPTVVAAGLLWQSVLFAVGLLGGGAVLVTSWQVRWERIRPQPLQGDHAGSQQVVSKQEV